MVSLVCIHFYKTIHKKNYLFWKWIYIYRKWNCRLKQGGVSTYEHFFHHCANDLMQIQAINVVKQKLTQTLANATHYRSFKCKKYIKYMNNTNLVINTHLTYNSIVNWIYNNCIFWKIELFLPARLICFWNPSKMTKNNSTTNFQRTVEFFS